jgi:hypothetical protein
MCEAFKLPFDLMIGVNRGVYEAGVYQGRDLYDSRVSLLQYKELFNAFPRVTFPISVLASVTNQELTSYAWIFPNVVTSGHWWYSNTPAFIEHDLAARLEAVPRTKQLGYYSDMYKLEFALPKFAMFKRILAKVLAERFVIDRGWSEQQAIALGTQVLRGNVESIFRWGDNLREELPHRDFLEPLSTSAPLGPIPASVMLEAERNSTPVLGESENLERLPERLLDRPAKEFVLPAPQDSPGEDFRLEDNSPAGAKDSGNEPPELEVIEDAAEDAAAASESARQTEPFPIKPAINDASEKQQWSFLSPDKK